MTKCFFNHSVLDDDVSIVKYFGFNKTWVLILSLESSIQASAIFIATERPKMVLMDKNSSKLSGLMNS